VLNDRCNGFTLMWASQVLGKTEIITTLILWAIDCGLGGGIMMALPTIHMAQAWSKLKLAPALKDLDQALEDRPFTEKGPKAQSTVQLKVYPTGYLVIGGLNSPTGLAMFTCRYVFFDEIDRTPLSVGIKGNIAGDPLLQTESRGETFSDSFTIKTSTPTTKGASKIEAALEATDYRKWHVRCVKCKERFVIEFKDIKWPKGEHGEHLTEEAFLECPKCAAHLSDAQRQQMVRRGGWVATRPRVKNSPGFWANAFICILSCKRKYANRLHQWAEEYLRAYKDPDMYRVWVNQVECRTYEEPAEKPTAPEILFERREHYFEGDKPVLPDGVLLLTVGADKQHNRIECELVGWGRGEESWSLDYRVFAGEFERKEFREQIAAWLDEKYYFANGVALTVASAAFDAGDKPESVHKFCREQRHKSVWAVRGRGGMELPWIRRSKSGGRLVNLQVDVAKATLFSRLTLIENVPGKMHFQFERDMEWYRQLCSEHLVAHTSAAQTYKRFELIGKSRNEALDCRVYAMAALGLLGRINWDALQARVTTPAQKDTGSSAPTQPAQPYARQTTSEQQRSPTQAQAQQRVRRPRRRFTFGSSQY
jgi:phage terminase large subunit GpA-like protein